MLQIGETSSKLLIPQRKEEKGKNDEEEEEEEEEDDGERVYSKIVRQSDGKKVTVQVKTKLKQVRRKHAH